MSSLESAGVAASARRAPRALARPRWVALLGAAGLLGFYGVCLVARPLIAPDEFRYAEVPREMLASGDWIVPRLDGVLYFEKPPLGYWASALSIRAFGETAAAVRLPFALATLCNAAIAFALVRRFGAGASAARATAIGLLTSVEVALIGTSAVLDALFALAVTGTLAALFAASEAQSGAARQRWLVLAGTACGAAFLTKGFLAFAIPVAVMVPYLVWSRRSRDLVRLPWTPLAVALLVAAPWTIAIARAEPDFWRQFVVNEHLRRFAGASPQHPEPFWYFLPVLAVGALPWTPLLASAWRRRADYAASPLLRFCACWLVAPVLLLSAASGKLTTYVLPCFPALFILLADGALAQPRARLARQLAWIAGALAAIGAVTAVVLLAPIPALGELFAADEYGKRVVLAAVVALVTGGLAATVRRGDIALRASAIAAAFALVIAATAIEFPTRDVAKTPERWLAEHVDPIFPHSIIVSDRNLVHAACWHWRRTDVRVLWSAGELLYGLERTDPARWLDYERLTALIRDPARTQPVLVIGRTGRTFLPLDLRPDRSETNGDAFFGVYEPLPPPVPTGTSDGPGENRLISLARASARAIHPLALPTRASTRSES
jgi:4-amino-4-deoxy-L-arabinose transferase